MNLVTTRDNMTQKEMSDLLEHTIFVELRKLCNAGQSEYARLEENAFANFDRVASDLEIPREKVLWTYAMKHKDGIASWINGHRSQREDVRGRIADLMLYLAILWAMVEESDGPKWVGPPPTLPNIIGGQYANDL